MHGPRAVLYAIVLLVTLSGASAPGRAYAQEDDRDLGEQLFEESCVTCHGPDGGGTTFGPPLRGVGAASADFQLRTGRMPLADPDAQAMRKEPAFDDAEIRALVDYVASLGDGPAIPVVHPELGDLSLGEQLFIENCAPCHGATAAGGAVGNAFAPSLDQARPVEIAEAMITGPGQMPVFALSDEEVDAVVAYIDFVRTSEDPGGLDVGAVGPVPEGFVAWLAGAGVLLLVVLFVAQPWRRDK